MEQIEKTCENCKWEFEDMEGSHCRHCIHNAEERFEPKEKELSEMEIRNKAIEEFAERLSDKIKCEIDDCADELEWIDEIAESMKGEKE